MKTDIHFGEINSADLNWRKGLMDEDPDDVELDVTPQDVIDILGFDPKEFSKPTVNTNPKGCNQHTGPNCSISRKSNKLSVPLTIPKSLKNKYEDLSEWHTHLASVYYKSLPASWDQKYKAEVVSSIAGQIRRGIETIKSQGGKLGDKNQDIVIRFALTDPNKLSNRGDTRYGSGDLAKVIAGGKDLTPVSIGKDSSGQRLLDGHHRMRAYQLAGKKMPSLTSEVVAGSGKIRFLIDSPPVTSNKFSPEARMKAILARRAQARIDRKTSSQKKASVKAQARELVSRLKKNLSDSKKLKDQKERDKVAVAKKEAKQKELKEQKVASLDKSKDEKKGPVMNNLTKALLILNAKKGWSEAARKKAALKRRMEFRAKQLAKAAKRPAAKSFGPSGIDSSGKSVYTTGDIESEVKAQRKRRKDEMRAFSKPVDSAAYQKVLDAMDRKNKKKGLSNNVKKKSGPSKLLASPNKKVKQDLRGGQVAGPGGDVYRVRRPGSKRKGWTDAARKKAAMSRKRRKSMNLSSHVAAGNYSYREATNKIEKARKTMENRIKIGAIAPEERHLFGKKVSGFHSNLTRKMDRMVKQGDLSPEERTMVKKEMKAFTSDLALSSSFRKTKDRQQKRSNSGKSPFGPG